MTVRSSLLDFFHNPADFAAKIDSVDALRWRRAMDEALLPARLSSGADDLLDSQKQAWMKLASSRVGLLLGPPGTGKTFLVACMALAYMEVCRRDDVPCRILFTGFTVNSILQLLREFTKHSEQHWPGQFPIAYVTSWDEPPLAPFVRMFHVGDAADRHAAGEFLDQGHCLLACTTWSLVRLLESLGPEDDQGYTRPVFRLVCIDEASQMMVGQGLMALAGLAPDGRVIVAGDHLQLPPVGAVFDRKVDERQLGGSLYSFLRTAGAPEAALVHTWRMNEPLTEFPRSEYYGNDFDPVKEIAHERLNLRPNWRDGLHDWEQAAMDPEYPVVVLMHKGPTAATVNRFEASLTTHLASLFHNRIATPQNQTSVTTEDFWKERFAIITPHRAHNAFLRNQLRATSFGKQAIVETVDRIQGQQRDTIITSYVVSDPEFALVEAEFLFSRERLNVATSRAKRKLILILHRSLLDVLPNDDETVEAAATLRRFVFGCQAGGCFEFPDPKGNTVRVDVRYRGFHDSPILDELKPAERPKEEVPSFTQALQDLLHAIWEVARKNQKYATAADWEIRKVLGRQPSGTEYVTLMRLGRVQLSRPIGPHGSFWSVRPLEEPHPPLSLPHELALKRVQDELSRIRRGDRFLDYEKEVKHSFVWVDEEGQDVLRPIIDTLAGQGLLNVVQENDRLLVRPRIPIATTTLELPELPPLEDADFKVLNRIEEIEKARINFGLYENWVRVSDLFEDSQLAECAISKSLLLLEAHSYLLLDEGRARSRMAELARELRYVKQRFRNDDADRRPFLVRNVKLELKDRDKPARDRDLSSILSGLETEFHNNDVAKEAIRPLGPMLRSLWLPKKDVQLAGFQERGLRTILKTWINAAEPDSFVFTAETGSGKTEAAFFPVLVGMAYEALHQRPGVKAVMVYPRILLAFNQAERFASYLAAYSDAGGPLLRMAVQATNGLRYIKEGDDSLWQRLGKDRTNFPLFSCPNRGCGRNLELQTLSSQNAERLNCPHCGWKYDGWVADRQQLLRQPPDLLVIVTESLHQWQSNPDYGAVFGDRLNSGPRVILADEIHLYSLTHGAQIGYTLQRSMARAERNTGIRPIAIGMSATLGSPEKVWAELSGRALVQEIGPEEEERQPNAKGREYFYFIQPEVESRGRDVAGASTSIQSIMVLAHGMRRRRKPEGGYRGLVFLDSIDKVRRLHGDYKDAEEAHQLPRFRVLDFNRQGPDGSPELGCCGSPLSCSRYQDGECWYFAANDRRQTTATGPYDPSKGLSVAKSAVTSQGRDSNDILRNNDVLFSTSSLEVGYDDPDLALVYQHYAPVNLASFIQRKGRAGRGESDRPVTGVTLSPYSPRDSWFFLRPSEMLSPRNFEIPLNIRNFFVRRGQLLAAIADMGARWKLYDTRPIFTDPQNLHFQTEFRTATEDFIVRVFGNEIYNELGFKNIEEIWGEALRNSSGFDPDSPAKWRVALSWIPNLLFNSMNLPLITVLPENEQSAGIPKQVDEDISFALSNAAPGNPTRRYSTFRFHWRPIAEGLNVWLDAIDYAHANREPLPGGSVAALLDLLPDSAAASLQKLGTPEQPVSISPYFSRPKSVHLLVAGESSVQGLSSKWRIDSKTRRLYPPGQATAAATEPLHLKSYGALRSTVFVEANTVLRRLPSTNFPANLGSLEYYRGATGDKTGLKVVLLHWGADATIRLDNPKSDVLEMTQFFRDPQQHAVLFHGYGLETEGVRLTLNDSTLSAFISGYANMLDTSGQGRWLRGRFLRYLLQSGSLANGLNIYDAARCAELLQAAAGDDELRHNIARLAQRWDSTIFNDTLEESYERLLTSHPLLTARRIEKLQERFAGMVGVAFRTVLETGLREVKDNALFLRYLRSLIVHGVAVRLHQSFVLLGHGDEKRVGAHAHLPIEHRAKNDDSITVFENGGHGDGTARTFIENVEELVNSWREGFLSRCPNATEDQAVENFLSNPSRHEHWRGRHIRDVGELTTLGAEIGLTTDDTHALSTLARLLNGREWVGNEPFDFFDIQVEVRQVRKDSEALLKRRPQLWELLTSVVQRARTADPTLPTLVRLLRAFETLPEERQEESLSPQARLAEQALRFSGSLCVDGCTACLYNPTGIVADGLEEASLSRQIMSDFSHFIYGN